MLNKINELFKDSIYKTKLSQKEQFNLVGNILSIDLNIIKICDNFDYTDKVPKLVLFLTILIIDGSLIIIASTFILSNSFRYSSTCFSSFE